MRKRILYTPPLFCATAIRRNFKKGLIFFCIIIFLYLLTGHCSSKQNILCWRQSYLPTSETTPLEIIKPDQTIKPQPPQHTYKILRPKINCPLPSRGNAVKYIIDDENEAFASREEDEEFQYTSQEKSNDNNDEGEKYLTYFPHSGFHNQRISLENAIFLAWYTNRTLVTSPIILGRPVSWEPNLSDTRFLRINVDLKLSDCPVLYPARSVPLKRCIKKVKENTLLKWEDIFDMEYIKSQVRILYREDFAKENLYKMLDIKDEKKDVLWWEEKARYDIGFFDLPPPLPLDLHLRKFARAESLCDIYNRQEKLVYFPSVYGSSRINLSVTENIEFSNGIKDSLVFNHPVMINIVEDIVRELGGLGTFLSGHVRVGDRIFMERKPEIIQEMIENLSNETEFRAKEKQAKKTVPQDTKAAKCQKVNTGLRNNIIFIATDANPQDPTFAPLREKFPCAFTLADFPEQMSPLDGLVNPRDEVELKGYFIPMIDLMVASRAEKFFGTEGSTFSKYSRRLHRVWVENEV